MSQQCQSVLQGEFEFCSELSNGRGWSSRKCNGREFSWFRYRPQWPECDAKCAKLKVSFSPKRTSMSCVYAPGKNRCVPQMASAELLDFAKILYSALQVCPDLLTGPKRRYSSHHTRMDSSQFRREVCCIRRDTVANPQSQYLEFLIRFSLSRLGVVQAAVVYRGRGSTGHGSYHISSGTRGREIQVCTTRAFSGRLLWPRKSLSTSTGHPITFLYKRL